MKRPVKSATASGNADMLQLLDAAAIKPLVVRCNRGGIIYNQGAAANAVFWIRSGSIKLSVVSSGGKEAVVAMLGPGDFFGEGCLAGQTLRMSRAKALTASTLCQIAKPDMERAIHEHAEFSERFMTHMLRRNIRIEEDLVDQLFNSSEKRLARVLLLLARYGTKEATQGKLAKISQATLAEMVGTTRPRVNFFMNKFRKMGFIEYNGGLKVNKSLLSVVLHDRGNQ